MRVRTQRVPVGYREVEYLESTGTQYIDCNISLENNFEIVLDQMNNFDTNNHYLCGSTAGGKMLGTLYNVIWSNGVIYSTVTFNRNIREILGVKMISDGSSYTDYTCTNFTTKSVMTGRSSFYLRGSGNVTLFRVATTPIESFKCFNCKIFKGGSLVRNFIPCIRTSDNKPGLYDTVNSTFYTNQGTGEFLYGQYKDSYKISYCNGMVEDDDPSDDIIKCHIRGG